MASPADNPRPEGTLSSPSAAWAIAGIALNTMTQPSGFTFGAPTHTRMAIRISPLICGVNTLFTILFIIWASWTRSFASALTAIKQLRFPPELDDSNTPGVSGFDAFRRNVWVRLVAFGLGLPPLIKLYATSGIPWLYLLSSIYTASFVVDELVLFAVSSVEQGPVEANLLELIEDIIHDAFRLIPGMVYWSFFMAWYLFIIVIVDSLFEARDSGALFLIIMSVLPAGEYVTGLKVPPSLDLDNIFLSFFFNLFQSFFVHCGILIPFGVALSMPSFVVTGILCHVILSLWLRPNQVWGVKLQGSVFGAFFLFIHVSILVLYFLFLYDESATWQGSWTENLG